VLFAFSLGHGITAASVVLAPLWVRTGLAVAQQKEAGVVAHVASVALRRRRLHLPLPGLRSQALEQGRVLAAFPGFVRFAAPHAKSAILIGPVWQVVIAVLRWFLVIVDKLGVEDVVVVAVGDDGGDVRGGFSRALTQTLIKDPLGSSFPQVNELAMSGISDDSVRYL
jgi:hypothetical protein